MKDEKLVQLSLFESENPAAEQSAVTSVNPSALPDSATEEWKSFYAALSHYASQLKPKKM